MRWILIVLLMCNGIYFLWQSSSSQPLGAANRSFSNINSQGGAAKLLLISESASNVSDGINVEDASLSSVGNICWLVGPFKEEVSGKQVVARLKALDINLRLASIEIQGKPDYWVHIPPQISRKAAIKLLRELQAEKIDSFLITEGDLADGISLGFFTQKSRAESVYEDRLKQGYGVEIKVVPRTYTELWAVFDTGEYGKFSDLLWEKIKEGNQGLERRKNYCDKIASVGNLD